MYSPTNGGEGYFKINNFIVELVCCCVRIATGLLFPVVECSNETLDRVSQCSRAHCDVNQSSRAHSGDVNHQRDHLFEYPLTPSIVS